MGMMRSLGAEKYDRQYDDTYLLKRVFTYFRPFRRRVAIIIALVIIFAVIGSLFPIIIAWGVGALESQAPDSTIILILGALLVNAVLDFFIFWARRRLTGRVVADVISQLRKDAFEAAVARDLAFYDENKSGKIVSRITNDTQELNQIIVISLDIVSQLVEFVILFFVLLSIEWRLTLILLGVMPVVFGVTALFRRFARIATRQGSRAMAAVNDNI